MKLMIMLITFSGERTPIRKSEANFTMSRVDGNGMFAPRLSFGKMDLLLSSPPDPELPEDGAACWGKARKGDGSPCGGMYWKLCIGGA